MASRHDIIHIDFQANAGKANVALQALQSEAEQARQKVEGLRNQLQNARNTNMPIADIQKLEKELGEAEKKAKQWQQALNNNMKGVRALDEAIKMFNSDLAGGKGRVDDMNAALAKQARNAAELQKRRSAEGSQTWKEMEALMVALDEQILKANTDLNGLVANIQKGGTASKATLTQARSDLQQMLTLEVRGSAEWNTYNNWLKVVEGELLKIAQAEQKVAKADKTAKMTVELKNLKTASSSALADMKRFWEQMVAGAEKGSGELAKYEANLKKVRNEEKRRSVAGAEQVLGNMSKFGIEQVRQAVQQMTQLRDTTQAGIPTWQHYNKLVKQGEAYLQEYAEREKIARGEAMSLADALKLSANAGGLGFKGTATQLQQAEQALQKAAAAAKKGSPEWMKYQEALAKVRVEMQNAGMTSERMQAIIAKPASAKNLNELQAAVKRAKAELDLMAGTVGKSSKAYTQLAESTKKAEIQLKALQSQSHGTASAFDKAWSRLKTYIGLYMGAAVAMQKLVGTMGDIMDLSDKMGEVRKTTGFTADEVGKLSANLAKMDVRTPLVQLMEVSASAGQLGLKTLEDVQGFTEAANKLMIALPEMGKEAATEMMRVAIATGEVEKIRKQMEEGLIEGSSATAVAMEKIASTIDRLRASSASTAPEITDFVKRVGAVGAQSGITIDQVAALGSTISSLGMRVEMSATALSRMIPAIKNNAFAVAKAIGVTPESLRNLFETGRAMEAILLVFQHIKDQNMNEDSIEKLLGMGGMQEVMKELNQMGARAGIVFSGLSQNVDELRRQLGVSAKAYKENIAIQQEFDKMNETTAAKWERLKNQLEEAFVSDGAQRFLGRVVDSLRAVVDALTGSDGMSVALKTVLFYLTALKVGLGEALIIKLPKAISALWALSTGFFTTAITGLKALTWQLGVHTMATGRARIAWRQLDATMKTNVIGAVAAALAYLIYKLYDLHKAAKEAAAEVGRFNQKIAEEQKALNSLFDPLNKSNTAQEERLRLINEINSKYGRYLGYMLSETSSAIQLADAHALIAKRIKEEAFQRRLAEKERKIQEEHDEDLSAAYGGIESAVRSGAKGGADIQAMADMLKSFADKNLNNVEIKWSGGYRILQDFTKDLNGMLERMAADGKLRHDDIREVEKAVYDYASEAKKQHDDIMSQTGNLRSDLRGIQGAIKYDLANNLNTLISNVANSVSNAVSNISKSQPQSQQNVPLMLQQPQGQGSGLPSLFGGDNQQGGWQAPWQQGGNRQTTPQQQMAPAGWKPNINKKDITVVRQFVADQDALRGALQASGQQIDEAQRKVAESWLLTDAELQEYRKILAKADRGGGGGGGSNPWGSNQSPDSTNYKDMAADVLVNRRKQMNEFVNAIQTDSDVKSVLAEDAALKKAIEAGMSSDMRTVIEWYNTERLKIQDELHARHLTNTGDWMDPKKERGAKKQFRDEMDAYLHELDAYYTERKTRIEQARNDEEITEGEAWRRTIQNDNEWQTRRAELQKLYSRKQQEVTKEELDAILHIIAERTGDSEAFVKAAIAKTNQFVDAIEKSGDKGAAIVHRWMSQVVLDTERSYLKAAQAIGKQMKFIEDTLAKERPYDGITKNLQDNLDKMGVLAAKYRRENEELARQGKEPKYSNEQITAQSFDEMAFYLRQAADAYSIDIDELLRRMVKEGMTATAEEISKSDMLKQAVMGQLRKTYQEVQDAVKKEASQIKKDVEIIWNDDARGIGGMSMKATFDKALAQLGMQQDSVSRANSLIGTGAASDNVASRLAMKQIEVQMRMQKAQYDMYRVQANQRMAALRAEAEEHRRLAKQMEKENHLAESKRELLMATNAERDAENVRLSLGLTLAEETKKEEQQKAELLKIQEESQNRLYTSLREWADLLTSSIQGVMEARHAGDAEYYNERAKLNLTGKGGPGAGTYVVIDDAGTSDATAHYEYLDERQALERQHEIEQQNAQAEAWKKLWDDINMKMSDQITDWLNQGAQQAALEMNSEAIGDNTNAINGLTGAINNLSGNLIMQGAQQAVRQTNGNEPNPTIERIGYEDVAPVKTDTKTQATETEQTSPFLPGVTPGISWVLPDDMVVAEQEQLNQRVQMQQDAIDKVRIANEQSFHKIQRTSNDTNKTMVSSAQSSFAKMALAANLYGVAYQAMSNDNLSATQKFEMIALQSVGNFAISSLTAFMSKAVAEGAVNEATVLGKLWSQLGWAAAPVFAIFTGLLGAAMGAATSAVSKSKSQIAQATGSSVGAGRLATGMLTYAEGNVNEFTDPASLTPGRQYNVDGADGRTYRARYMGKDAKTHITNGPEFHLVGEKGREAIIDAHTTRLMQTDDTGIWQAIQTLYNGGRVSGFSTRRGRGVRAFAEGNLNDFEGMLDGETAESTGGGMSMEQMLSFQQSLDANTAIMQRLADEGIEAFVSPYGKRGIVNGYDTYKKEALRHGEKYT